MSSPKKGTPNFQMLLTTKGASLNIKMFIQLCICAHRLNRFRQMNFCQKLLCIRLSKFECINCLELCQNSSKQVLLLCQCSCYSIIIILGYCFQAFFNLENSTQMSLSTFSKIIAENVKMCYENYALYKILFHY